MESGGREESPCDGRRTTGLAAVFTMAKTGLQRVAVDFVTDGTAEAATSVDDRFRHGEREVDPTSVREIVEAPR